ncbi:uncharacterized protein si:ch211-153b23.4 [Esox lucius]|nr:uncharacterized protein si:ch211-153b23.4 [Esox lucius]
MAELETESLHFSVGILGISGGSLLLLVNNYGSSPDKYFIPHTALGVLLLIIAALLAYSGVRRSLAQSSLFSSVCLSVSALWCGSGLVHLLIGEGVVGASELKSSLVPGLAAFALALLILATVSILQREVVLFIICLSISLACGHQIAGLSSAGFGQSGTAACYLLVTLVGVYFGCGRLLSYITQGRVEAPGTELRKRALGQGLGLRGQEERNDVVPVGLVMNLLSASVLACPLLGVVPQLSVGHVPWLWTAGVFQVGVCILSFRYMDPLAATFYGLTSILRFAEGYTALLVAFSIFPSSPVPFPVVFSVLFFILALFSCQKGLSEGLYQLFYVAYTIALAAQPSLSFQAGAQGVQGALYVLSAVMLLVTSYNNVSANRIPTGEGVFKALVGHISSLSLRPHSQTSHTPYLGYSRYADAEVLGHACSVLAAFSITVSGGSRAPLGMMVLPWAVVAGGVLQLLVGSVAFSRGKTLESTAFLLYGVLWSVWGLTRYGGLYGDVRSFNLAVGIISFLLFNTLVTFGALLLNVTWLVYAATFQLIIISFLLDAVGALPYGYDIGVSIVFGLVSFYCFLSGLFNMTFLTPCLPQGQPLVRLSGTGGGKSICPHVPARKATAVHQIAEIMKSGGICGIPTDTVYVLVAACNRPEAVEKAYRCKQQAQDRPMSLWVSSINQLEPVRSLLSPLLWDFMSAAWPSSISMVIARGPWMEMFGLGESSKHIGTTQSIAIRNPDCAVATHLMNMVGPIAVTSANPTGEADTTHHNQVYAKLGDKVDGVLCDGPSPENIASTVVDCTKIDSGHIGFFRVGVIPKSQVLQIFTEVQKRHFHGQMNPGFEADQTESDLHLNFDSNITENQTITAQEDENTPSTDS